MLTVSCSLAQSRAGGELFRTDGTCSPNSNGTLKNPAPQDGNNTLGNIYNVTKCGLNFVQASSKVTSRNLMGGPGSGLPCTLPISGIPATCRNIEKAYIWFVASFMPGDPSSPSVIVTNPLGNTFNYVAATVGTAPEKCWGEINTRTFRVDATNAVSGNGNYVINSNMSSNSIDGMTLFIIYSDVTATYQGSLIINDGAMSANTSNATLSNTLNGFTACGNSTACSAFALNSDFQLGAHASTLNGVFTPFADLFYNFDLSTTTTVTSGQTTSAFGSTSTSGFDCFSLIMAGLYFQTTTCTVCPAPLTISITNTPAACGNNNGSATATPSTSQYGPYSYSWNSNPVQTTQTATGLSPGNYTVTVSDPSGCITATASVTITGTPPPTITINPSAIAICQGNSTTITGSGAGVGGTYLWSTGATTAAITVSPTTTTTYTVTGTTTGGCSGTSAVTVTVNPNPTPAITGNASICSGQGTTLTASGGGTYSWSTGATTASISVTPSSTTTYTVTVTNSNNCSATAVQTVTVNAGPSANTTVSNASCNQANGSATVNASGGSGSYTYVWSPGGQTGVTATALTAGSYTVVVTDAATGCTQTATAIVNNSNGPAITNSSFVSPACNGGNNGTATVTATGNGLIYLWTPSNQTTATATGLSSGSYTVTISDQNGCTITQIFVLNNPSAITVNPTSAAATCSQSNGTATANASGGTGNLSYLWSPGGQTASTATGLSAGTFTVTVTDANGCTQTATVAVTNSSGPVITSSNFVDPLCNGNSNGSASITVTGNGLNYLWSNGQTTSSATGLSAGTYTVVVSDANGCTTTQVFTLNQPTPVTASAAGTPATCNSSNGIANAAGNGGTMPYTYLWSTGQTGSNATGLSAGTYTVTVTDANGCSQTTTVQIVNSNGPTTSVLSQNDPQCNGGTNGDATVNVNGGTAPYSYVWNNGQTTVTATGLSAGTYTCLISDANGCTTTQVVTIAQPSPVTASTNFNNENCGSSDGDASATGSGGTGPYSYIWSNAQTGSSISGLSAGTYSVLVTDANGCTTSASVTLISNAGPVADAGVDVSILLGDDAQLNASGGTTYVWSPSGGLSCSTCANPLASPEQTTEYCVTVTDVNGCSSTDCMTVTVEIPCPENIEIALPNAFTPNGDGNNDLFLIDGLNNCVTEYTLTIYDRWGEKVFETNDFSLSWDGTFKGKDMDAAVFVYYFSATFTNGKSVMKKGNISLIK